VAEGVFVEVGIAVAVKVALAYRRLPVIRSA